MMKVLVFSDSHGNTHYMEEAVQRDKPDLVLHLGDINPDARALQAKFPDLPMEWVCGNCDGLRRDLEKEKLILLEGHRVLMMHGHTRDVKFGLTAAVLAAREQRAEVLLFGHTHDALCEYEAGLWVMNPGTVRGGWEGASYGVISVEGENVVCYTQRLK